MDRRLQWVLVAAVVVLAACLRFTDLGLIEFKGDEAVAIDLAVPMAEGEALPRVGMVSSVGVHNPPLFVWLTALPLLADHDPRFVTGALVGLLSLVSVFLAFVVFRRRFGPVTALAATAFYGTCTWPVLYARKLWAQDALPIFSLLLLWAVFRVWERPRTRWVAAVPLLCGVLWQLHFSAFAVILVVAALLLGRWRMLDWRWLAAGVAGALLMMGPWLSWQGDHDWEDFRGLGNIASGRRADGSRPETPKTWSLQPAAWSMYATAGTAVDYALGAGDDEAFGQPALARWAGPLSQALLVAGLFLLIIAVARRRDGRSIVLVGWLLGYVAIYLLLRLEHVWPHYFIILYPAPFLAMALPIGALAEQRRWGPPLALALATVVVAGHLWNLGALRSFVSERGGAAGDYGVALEHKQALTDWLVADGFDIQRAPGWEYGHLLRTRRRYDAGPPPDGRKKVIVYDTLRQPARGKTRCPGRRDFGPLVACPRR